MTIWTIKKGMERRFLSGHPWVYSNELSESPKGVAPGQVIELRDHQGRFLAKGFGNPQSLIAFRCLSRSDEPMADYVERRLKEAWQFRQRTHGFSSFRWVHAEADHFPGLVMDYYHTSGGPVLAIQLNSAASESLLPTLLRAIPKTVPDPGAVIIHRGASVRKLEGLRVEEPEVSGKLSRDQLEPIDVTLRPGFVLKTHLLTGQKTGLFLDQLQNIELVGQLLHQWSRPLRILDLCCYVGQWGTGLAQRFPGVKVTGFDASAAALKLAGENVRRAGSEFTAVQGDIMENLHDFKDESFDIVICDPPALIKNRKSIAAGVKGYQKINAESLRILAPGGAIVSCSCSGLLEEAEFQSILARAVQKSGREVRWIGRGGFSVDHPKRAEFSEGSYLKVWVGVRL